MAGRHCDVDQREDITLDPEEHLYTVQGTVLHGCTEVMAVGGLVDTQWYTEDAKKRGTAVHLATQYYDEGDLNEASLSPALAEYLDAYKRFLDQKEPEWTGIEVAYRSVIYGYACIIDRVGWFGPERVIVDLKTGAVTKNTGPQTAAQAQAYEETTGNKIHKRYGLYLKDGRYDLREYNDPNDFNYYTGALWVARYKGLN